MAQYISKSALVAEIKRRMDECINSLMTEQVHTLSEVLDSINILEVKEVDLEKEIRRYRMNNPIIGHREESLHDYMANVAKHFFELGLKAKDWEKERMEECPYRQVGCTMYEDKILECRGACSWVVDYPKLRELKARKGE